MHFLTILEILIFVALLAAFFWFVLLKFVLPLCTGAWVAVRYAADVVLAPFIVVKQFFRGKRKPAAPVDPLYDPNAAPHWMGMHDWEAMRAQQAKRKKQALVASWGGKKTIAWMVLCVAVILVTVLFVAIRSLQAPEERFWEELFFSIPVLSLIKLFNADSFSMAVLAELVLFNLLAGLFMRRSDSDETNPHVTLKDVFSYSLIANIKENLREMSSKRNAYGTPVWVTVLITILYDILFTFFGTCVMFWLPDEWYPSPDALMGWVVKGADYMVDSWGAIGYLPAILLFVLVGYLSVCGLALLIREFTATVAFAVVPLTAMILIYGVLSAIFSPSEAVYTAMWFVLATLASIWQCFYRGHVEDLYEDYRRTKRLEKRPFLSFSAEGTAHSEEAENQ